MTTRPLVIIGAVVAVVLLGVAAFVLSPSDRDPNAIVVAVIAPTVVSLLSLLGIREMNGRLNGAMDKHLANAKDIGVSAARSAVHDAAAAAVDKVMADAMRTAKIESAGAVAKAQPPPNPGTA